uniref:Uncharacterized protein n=1 Tax=Oryza sativa subsp. japonica TaxID=39947 RepID=Q2QQV0_ORYSJ|nr:hypothetical protein LOC_Os12g29780 [Oryza sativa Japonica Group]
MSTKLEIPRLLEGPRMRRQFSQVTRMSSIYYSGFPSSGRGRSDIRTIKSDFKTLSRTLRLLDYFDFRKIRHQNNQVRFQGFVADSTPTRLLENG